MSVQSVLDQQPGTEALMEASLGLKKPYLIGVAGGSASGKTTACKRIIKAVGDHNLDFEHKIVTMSQDSFYCNLTREEMEMAKKGTFNFDHPDAFDHELMLSCLHDISNGRPTNIPIYDFTINARLKQTVTVMPVDVVLLEGILIFYHPDVRDLFDMKLFVDSDPDTRLARRVQRDITHRGRELDHIIKQYTTLVKPAFEQFCLPTKKFADVIIPRGGENTVAIELVAQHVSDIISSRSSSSDSSRSSSLFNRSRSSSNSLVR